MKRRIYLRMKSLEEARSLFLNRFPLGGWRAPEEVIALEACGRVTAHPCSPVCRPPRITPRPWTAWQWLRRRRIPPTWIALCP